jgi:opacity protein-like surface antigen
MKKRLLVVLLSLGLLLTLSANVMAEDKPRSGDPLGIYIAATGGVPFPSTMYTSIINTTTGSSIVDRDITLNSGWIAGAKLGWQTSFTKKWLAIEAEYNHMENTFDSGTPYSTSGINYNYDSKVKIDSGMLNLIGRYPEGKIHPYVGAGAGYAYVQLDEIRRSFSGIALRNMAGGSKGVFAYQFMCGFDFELTDHIFMGVGYKYFVANKAQFDTTITTPYSTSSDPGTVEVDYKAHVIAFTVGFMF